MPTHAYTVLKKAIARVGAKRIAQRLNVSTSLVYKWGQDAREPLTAVSSSGTTNPLDRLRIIYEESQDPGPIHWMCAMADGHFVKNAHRDHQRIEANVLKNIQRFIKEFSEALDAITSSYHHDKQITPQEAQKIRKEWDDLKRIGEGFVAACEAGCFKKH